MLTSHSQLPERHRIVKVWTFALVSVALMALAGCSPANHRPEIAPALDAAVAEAGDGGVVDFRDVASFEWDTLFGFPGYTSDAEVSATTGADFGGGDDSRVNEDGENLVVLLKDGRVIAWTILNQDENAIAVRLDDALYSQAISKG
jgi:hypothetical protein